MVKHLPAPLILASTSKYRQALLKEAGLSFKAVASLADEKKHEVPGNPKATAALRARVKGEEVAMRFPGHIVIGADQVCALGLEIFGKASSAVEAKARLRQMSGKTHELHSAFSLLYAVKTSDKQRSLPVVLFEEVVTIPMDMRPLTDQEIDDYLQTGEWQGVAGCYQAENQGATLFTKPLDDLSAIIGLPLNPLSRALAAIKLPS